MSRPACSAGRLFRYLEPNRPRVVRGHAPGVRAPHAAAALTTTALNCARPCTAPDKATVPASLSTGWVGYAEMGRISCVSVIASCGLVLTLAGCASWPCGLTRWTGDPQFTHTVGAPESTTGVAD